MPRKRFKPTKETRKKISLAHIGKKKNYYSSSRFKKGLVPWITGKKHSFESIKKMRMMARRLRPYRRGKKLPPLTLETRKKISLSHKLLVANGTHPILQFNKSHKGKNHPHWKGGISTIDKICRGMDEYKRWRAEVLTRDNWMCQTCGTNHCYVMAHHVVGFSKLLQQFSVKNADEARKVDQLWDINNGITLCESCHKLTDNYKGRARRKE